MRLPNQQLFNKINQYIKQKGGENYTLFLLGSQAGLRISEAINFDYHQKHPRYKNLYLVKGKGQKNRYVYVSKEIICELKKQNWKFCQTNRCNFYNFLQKTKKELNISPKIELTPHTLRRFFTTRHALNGVPMPVLQKALGHRNIRTTSFYWKGSVDIREFKEWLEPEFSPKEPEEVLEISSEFPKIRQVPIQTYLPASPFLEKETKCLKIIEKLKGGLEQKDLIITEKDKQLQNKNRESFLLINENKKLQIINREKDRRLKELQKCLNELSIKNNSLIEKYAELNNSIKIKWFLSKNNNRTLNSFKSSKVENFLERIKELEGKLSKVRAENNNLKLENKHLKDLIKQEQGNEAKIQLLTFKSNK